MSSRARSFTMPARQAGFTMVEVLIAGVLGLVLLAGVGELFLGSSATFRMQRQIADIQDSGRFAMWFLKNDIERAGWFVGGGPVGAVALEVFPAPGIIASVAGVDGGGNVSDQLTVAYESTVPGTDCNGSAVGAVVQNLYFVDGNRQLVCTGNGGATQPLVSNVDSLQVLYGIDVSIPPEVIAADRCSDRAVDQFVLASGLTGNEVIVAIRFSLLIGGETNSSVPATNRVYQVADRSIAFNDQIIRRVFTLTTAIKNVAPIANPCPTS